MNILISITVIVLVINSNIGLSNQQDVYDNHYDLKAKDASYLCILMDEYLKTGKQPSLSVKPPDKKTYTRGDKCWKFKWIPCDPGTYTHSNERPCGYYQMGDAPNNACK